MALERLGTDGIACKGVVSPAQSLRVMRDARSLLLLLPMDPRWATCVPSKMYSYLFTERPILAVVPEGDAARIVRATGSGVAVTAMPERGASGWPTSVRQPVAEPLGPIRSRAIASGCDDAPLVFGTLHTPGADPDTS